MMEDHSVLVRRDEEHRDRGWIQRGCWPPDEVKEKHNAIHIKYQAIIDSSPYLFPQPSDFHEADVSNVTFSSYMRVL
jgi:hypothetical protein